MAATSHDFWLTFLHAAGLEEPAHGAIHRHGRGDACRARHHAIRTQPGHPADAGWRISPPWRSSTSLPAGASAHLTSATRLSDEGWISVGRRLRSRTRACDHCGARRRTHRGLPGRRRVGAPRIYAPIKTVRSGKAASSTVASPAPGTATNTGSRTAARPPRSRRSSRPTACASRGIVEVDPRPLPPGTPAAIFIVAPLLIPAFKLPDYLGSKIRLSDVAGKVLGPGAVTSGGAPCRGEDVELAISI